MELASQEIGMAGKLTDLHKLAVVGLAGDAKPLRGELLFESAVELVAVAVPFADHFATVSGARERAMRKHAIVSSQTHGSAEFVDSQQVAELIDNGVLRSGLKLSGIGAFQAADIARKLDDRCLHAE